MSRNRPTNLGVDRIRVNRVRRPPRPPVDRAAVVQVVDAAVLVLVLAEGRDQVPVRLRVPVRDQVLVVAHVRAQAQAHVRALAQVAAGVRQAVAADHRPVPVRVRAGPRVDRAAAPDRRDDSGMNFFEATMAIGAAEKLDIETAELLIRVENSGDVLYNELASRLNNEEAADLLRKNGREEVGHARRMMKVLSLKLGTEYVPSAEVLEKFEVDLPDSLDASSLPMIVEGELQGDIGYQKWASHETDPEIIELLLRNGREETKHAERIKQAIAILEAAEAGA